MIVGAPALGTGPIPRRFRALRLCRGSGCRHRGRGPKLSVASVILVVELPLDLVDVVRGPLTNWVWLPMFFFEVPLGVWLMARAVPEEAAAG